MTRTPVDPMYTHIFLGKTTHQPGDLIASYEACHSSIPRPPHMCDRSVYHDRHYTRIQDIEIVRGPARHSPMSPTKEPIDSTLGAIVRFPLQSRAFKGITQRIDAQDAHHMDALLSKTYVVLFGYKVHEDHGNAVMPAFEPWIDLGVNPGAPNKGFDTMAQAQEYAASLMMTP